MDTYDEMQLRRTLGGILMQILYFSLRSISCAVDRELLASGLVSKKDLPQEPMFAPPRRNSCHD